MRDEDGEGIWPHQQQRRRRRRRQRRQRRKKACGVMSSLVSAFVFSCLLWGDSSSGDGETPRRILRETKLRVALANCRSNSQFGLAICKLRVGILSCGTDVSHITINKSAICSAICKLRVCEDTLLEEKHQCHFIVLYIV